MSIITGIPGGAADLKELASELKSQCGSGGTVRGSVIEIQGDHRDKLVKVLTDKGFTVKRSGG